MIARMMDAVRIPEPFGIPENSRSQMLPDGAQDIRGASIYVANSGANTNRPHMPYTIEGMPASNSTAMPMGRLSALGQNSTRKTAVQNASGRASARAMAEVIRVPRIGPAPPYTSVTGFQTVDVKKRKPNVEIEDQPPQASM